MSINKKTYNLIIGIGLLVIGVILILCGAFGEIIEILLGIVCLIAALTIAIKSIITKKKILQLPVVLSAVLICAGVVCFISGGMFAVMLETLINYSLIAIGGVMLIDTIFHFIKKRSLAANIVELVLAAALVTVGALALVYAYEISGLVFYFTGALIILAGIVVIIASVVDFNKYLKPRK